jgi:hypothetical protein
MSTTISDIYKKYANAKQDFKADWKEDTKKDFKTDWAETPVVVPPPVVPGP